MTAGFVANMSYCLWDSGLARGFTHYEDHLVSYRRLRMVKLLDLANQGLIKLKQLRTNQEDREAAAQLKRPTSEGFHITGPDRDRTTTVRAPEPGPPLDHWPVEPASTTNLRKEKDAATVSRQFLTWLTKTEGSGRPFFVFLNYMDAHQPFWPLHPEDWHFGVPPRSSREWDILAGEMELAGPGLSAEDLSLASDAYDNCIRALDVQLGRLFDELEKRGILRKTLVIVTSDHGEGLGEHGLLDHGVSLYANEVQVPLLIMPPGPPVESLTVNEFVSLRDLPSTIVAAVGLGASSPFPGTSLTRFWDGSASTNLEPPGDPVVSEVLSARPHDPNGGRSPAEQPPLSSIAEGDLVYIRNGPRTSEEMYNLCKDPGETRNLVGDESMQPALDRLRHLLSNHEEHGTH
jgi:arylsulfatase A-like enzyme